jgi:hypothetical protein
MTFRYKPSIGGHAPGHLRQAFLDALDYVRFEDPVIPWYAGLDECETICWPNTRKQAWLDTLTPRERGRWLIGQLWNCTDCLPASYVELLDLTTGYTYARAVRVLREEMD